MKKSLLLFAIACCCLDISASTTNNAKVSKIEKFKRTLQELPELFKQCEEEYKAHKEQGFIAKSKSVFIQCIMELERALIEFLPGNIEEKLRSSKENINIQLEIHRQIVNKGGIRIIDKIGKLIREMSEIVNTLGKIYGVEVMRTMFDVLENGNGGELALKIYTLFIMAHKWALCCKLYSEVEEDCKDIKGFKSGGGLRGNCVTSIEGVFGLIGHLKWSFVQAFGVREWINVHAHVLQ